jgi:hypothetical protein
MAKAGKTKPDKSARSPDGRVSKNRARAGAAVSGLRGVGSGIIGTLLANQVRSSAGKAGLLGMAAGTAFNILLKRSPMGAVVFGGAILARQAFRAGKDAQAKRDAGKALAKGAFATPPTTPAEAKAAKIGVAPV